MAETATWFCPACRVARTFRLLGAEGLAWVWQCQKCDHEVEQPRSFLIEPRTKDPDHGNPDVSGNLAPRYIISSIDGPALLGHADP